MDEAIELARQYLTEFKENWGEDALSALKAAHPSVDAADRGFAAPQWDEVRKLCGLDVLLPTENKETD
ncbi:MAG: hypothetical protein ACREXX_15920 [Gammaproteobacteria bacterium]